MVTIYMQETFLILVTANHHHDGSWIADKSKSLKMDFSRDFHDLISEKFQRTNSIDPCQSAC